MTIEKCYELIEGNYNDVVSRLMDEKRVEKYMLRFLDTKDFDDLTDGINSEDLKKAFLAAHTIKGIALNLGFTKYAESSSELCEYLRPLSVSDNNKLKNMYESVKNDYEKLVKVINQYKEELN